MAVEVTGTRHERYDEILTEPALGLIERLHREYDGRRRELLERRRERVAEIAAGGVAGVPAGDQGRAGRPGLAGGSTAAPGLIDRRVEITGPTDRKMTINALNSGAKVWLADQEDANTPTWENVVGGQLNLLDAITRKIDFSTDAGRVVRAEAGRRAGDHRGPAARLASAGEAPLVDGEVTSGSLVDFALYLAACGQLQLDRGQGPYFYLPKMESHLEARLWNDVFVTGAGVRRHPARHDPGDRADRDVPGRVRDGGDPLRAARALGRAERGSLGLHVQRDQDVPDPRHGLPAAGPRTASR